MGIVTRIMQQYPEVEQSSVEELVRRGYTEDEIRDMLNALEENANNAGYRQGDPRRTRSINVALAALLRRFDNTLNNEPYVTLLDIGYLQSEIRSVLFTNLMPMTQLLFRTAAVRASGGYDRLYLLGYTDVEIRSFIRAGFTVSQLRALADRVNDAERNGVDAQGLTVGQINDMLFKVRPINGRDTLGIVKALLSGIDSKVREGEVARCILDFVTLFDVPYGLGGAQGQVDVGTRHIIIEAKVSSVTGGEARQVRLDLKNDTMNPLGTNKRRKFVILYAPGYSDSATASVQKIGGYVVKSCKQLREQIRQLGGP